MEALDRALHSLYFFYDLRGLILEGERAFLSAQSSLEADGADEHPLTYARVLIRRGVFLTRLAQYEEANHLFELSLPILRAQNNLAEEAFAQLMYGSLQSQTGRYEVARKTLYHSLEQHRTIDHPLGIGRTLSELGSIEYYQGHYRQAEELHRESLRIFREINDNWGLARTLSNLGNVESELGDYLKAKQYYLESLDLCAVIGLKSGTAATLNNIGDIARETSDANEAREYLNRSIQAAIELGDQYVIAMALGNLGDVEFRTGKLEAASQYLKQSLEVCNLTNDNLGAAYTLSIMGNVAVAQGDFPQAAEYFYTALRYDAENDAVPQLLQTAIGIAELNYRSGRLQDALELLFLARDHPAVSRFYRQDAVKLIRLIEAELPGEAVREIQEHVAGFDEQATIQHILQAAPQAP